MTKTSQKFEIGDVVQFTDSFSEGDESAYLVTEWNLDRGFIEPLTPLFTINPVELVTSEMIRIAPILD